MSAPAYVPFVSNAIRELVPILSDEVWRFFCLLAAHRDAHNLAFPGHRAFMALGFNAESVTRLYQQVIDLGLVRLVKEGGKDEFGRYVAPLYQVNPAVVHIDGQRRAIALGMGTTSFRPLPTEPDRRSPVTSDPAEPVVSNSSLNPDRVFPSIAEPALKQNHKQNQEAESARRIQSESEAESHTFNGKRHESDPRHIADLVVMRQPSAISTQNGGQHNQNQNAGQYNPPLVPPLPPHEQRTIDPYRVPMVNSEREALAKLFTIVARNTRIEYARMYVDEFGQEPVAAAVRRMLSLPDEQQKEIRSRTAMMVKWCKEAGQEAAPIYRLDDLASCEAAIADLSLTETERSIYVTAAEALRRNVDQYEQYILR